MFCKVCILKSFKNLYKIINVSIYCNVADVLYLKSTQREIGHSKGTPREL